MEFYDYFGHNEQDHDARAHEELNCVLKLSSDLTKCS